MTLSKNLKPRWGQPEVRGEEEGKKSRREGGREGGSVTC